MQNKCVIFQYYIVDALIALKAKRKAKENLLWSSTRARKSDNNKSRKEAKKWYQKWSNNFTLCNKDKFNFSNSIKLQQIDNAKIYFAFLEHQYHFRLLNWHCIKDRAERHDFRSRVLLLHSPFRNQSRGQKSCLSARSVLS